MGATEYARGSDGICGHQDGTDRNGTGTAGSEKAAQRKPSLNCILRLNRIHRHVEVMEVRKRGTVA